MPGTSNWSKRAMISPVSRQHRSLQIGFTSFQDLNRVRLIVSTSGESADRRPGNGTVLFVLSPAWPMMVVASLNWLWRTLPETSRGTIFSNKVVVANTVDTINWLKQNKVKMYAAALSGKKNYTKIFYISFEYG